MATLFKKTITRWLADGKRVKASEAQTLEAAGHVVQRRIQRSRKWYIRYRLPDGRIRQVAGYVAGLRRLNPEPDRRVVRRALSSEELARLVQAAESSQSRWRDLDGRDRAAIYMLAAGSGLRAHEVGMLTYADLLLDANSPRVTVRAAYAKNRRQDTIPLPRQVAEYLRNYLASRPSVPADQAKRIWPGTWWQRAAGTLRVDLQTAGVEYTEASGRVADFHGLRSTYATLLGRQGVNLQTAQALLRHSDPKLTARTYTKLGVTHLAGPWPT